MSCIGIDIGQQNAVVAIARRGGIDILTNEVSKRLTASMVGFSGKERKLGEAALSGITSNLKNTITGIKAIIGKKFHSDDIQMERQLVAYDMVDVAGKVGLPVQYSDEQVSLTPERAMAMFMKCLQSIAENDQKVPVTDVVISVPAYFTDAERHSMLDAANIAGLNCLRLMNDVTAAALAYGIYKTDMPADKATHVVFVDCGAMDTTVSIVSFVKGKLTVLSTACDRHLGGRDFDMILADHFAAEWKEKHKIDAKSNKKAMYRLLTACEKTKKVLSANPQAPINIECFMEDIDVKGMMDRADMLAVGEPFLVKLDQLMAEALAASGLAQEDINSVELIGGTCRIPAVQDRIKAFFGKDVSKTLNLDECIAKGCALQAAMLSPAFKVRDFSVNDVTLYPIALSWSSSGGAAAAESMEVEGESEEAKEKPSGSSTVVFSKFNSVPNTKMLTFYRKDTFSLAAAYDASCQLPNGFPTKLAEFTVSDIPPRVPDEEGKVDPAKIKVKLRLDIHGCLTLESAVSIEEQEVIEEPLPPPPPGPPPPPPPPPAAESSAPATAPPAEGDAAAAPEPSSEGKAEEGQEQPAPPSADGEGEGASAAAADAAADTAADTAAADAPPPEKKKTKKVKRIALSVQTKNSAITAQELMDAQEAEGNMRIQDKLMAQTAEAMNTLETAVYALRDDLSQRLEGFFTAPDKEKLGSTLTTLEDWLYDEGADAEKSVYEQKLKELKDAFAGGELRAQEASLRPDAFAQLASAIDKFSAFAASQSEDYAHIGTEEKQKVATECAQAQAWLAETQAKFEALDKTADPPIKATEIISKASSLSAVCDPIMKTPKPLPMEPEPAPAAEVADDAAAATEGATEGEPASAEAQAEEGEEPSIKPDNMDVD